MTRMRPGRSYLGWTTPTPARPRFGPLRFRSELARAHARKCPSGSQRASRASWTRLTTRRSSCPFSTGKGRRANPPVPRAGAPPPKPPWRRFDSRELAAIQQQLKMPFFGCPNIHTGHSYIVCVIFVRVLAFPRGGRWSSCARGAEGRLSSRTLDRGADTPARWAARPPPARRAPLPNHPRLIGMRSNPRCGTCWARSERTCGGRE